MKRLGLAGVLMCVVIWTACVNASETGGSKVVLTDDGGTTRNPGPMRLKIVAERGESPPALQMGTADVTLGEVSVFGGKVGVVAGPESDLALDFPAFDGGPDPARSVIAVTNTGKVDALDPKGRPFFFAGTIRLDRRSEGSAFDNGDNVLQRGLATDPVQFKMEIDHGIPRCTVRGRRGTVSVRTRATLARDRWYTVRCERVADRTLRIVVRRGGVVVEKRRASGAIGRVAFRDPGVPVALGGKVDAKLRLIDRSTDQFNGQISNATFGFLN